MKRLSVLFTVISLAAACIATWLATTLASILWPPSTTAMPVSSQLDSTASISPDDFTLASESRCWDVWSAARH